MVIPYENFFTGNYKPTYNLKVAENIINSGWKKGVYPKLNLNKEIPWELKDEKYRSWNFELHALSMLDRVLLAYNDSKELKFLFSALNIAEDWLRAHVDSAGKRLETVSPFAWYDMAVGMRAYRLAFIYDASCAAGIISAESEKIFWAAIKLHNEYFKEEKNIAYHSNHGYYQAVGQMALGRRFCEELAAFKDTYQLGIVRFKKMLAQQFTDEGVHKEHSPFYHRMVYITLQNVVNSGLINDEEIIIFTDKIEKSLSWFITPDQKLVNFGDSYAVFIGNNDPKHIQGWSSSEMRFMVSGGAEGELPEDKLKFFKKSGYVIVRENTSNNDFLQDYSYLAFNGAFHSRTHKHSDDLSFVWSELGENILIDAGRYGYIDKTKQGSDLWLKGFWYADPIRIFCESTRAHNTLEFDNADYPRRNVKAYGSAILEAKELSSGIKLIVAEHKIFKSIKRVRTILYKPGEWMLVFDWFKDYAHKRHVVKQWFNFSSDLKLERINNTIRCISSKLDPITVTPLFDENIISEVYQGIEEPRKIGFYSPSDGIIEKSSAINISMKDKKSGNIGVLFNLQGDSDLDIQLKPNIVNKSGRNIRVSWYDSSGKHEVMVARKDNTSVDYFFEENLSKPNIQPKSSEDNILFINIRDKFNIDGQYRFLLYDCVQKKYVIDLLSEEVGVTLELTELAELDRYKYKIRVKENKKWIDTCHGFTYFKEKKSVRIGEVLQYLHFESIDVLGGGFLLNDISERVLASAVRNIVKDGEYFLLKSPNKQKAEKILLYVEKLSNNDFMLNKDIRYMCGFFKTLALLILESNCGERKVSEEKIKLIGDDAKLQLEEYKVGTSVAIGHYYSSFDRDKAYLIYKAVLKLNYSLIDNFLSVDALSTYFDRVPLDVGTRSITPLIEYSYTQDKYNLCFSSDPTYFRKYMYSWSQYSLYFKDVNFNILLVCKDYEEFTSLVSEYKSFLSEFTKFSGKENRNNIRFYFMKCEGGNKTLFACARFYLAKFLLNLGISDLYISDIDQISKGNIDSYLLSLRNTESSVMLPISGDLFEWVPWRNFLAGNVYIKNNEDGKKFLKLLVDYSNHGLTKPKSWMLDQNALAYASQFVQVTHLHTAGPRIFEQFSPLSKVFEA